MPARTIIVGDIHGCADELSALLQACNYRRGEDRLVAVGDLVAKGPKSLEVLALCRQLGVHSVMGNHDYALVAYARARAAGEERRLRPGHAAVAAQLSEADWAYLDALPFLLPLPELDALVVHAGLVPGMSLDAQDPALLMNLRTLTPDGKGSTRWDAGPLWGARYAGPPHIYFGHHAREGLQQHPWATGLDTGCVYGHHLTACILPEGRLVSVPAQRVYVEVD